MLISRFPQLLAQDTRKVTILHYAMLLSRGTVARMLVMEHHMDPSHCDSLGLSALSLAICCRQDSTATLSHFVTRERADLSNLNFPILLLLSIYTKGPVELMYWIGSMASMAPVREEIKRGYTEGWEERPGNPSFLPQKEAIGPLFVDAGLIWAIWANNHYALYWLLGIGADVNKRFKDIHFLTPLHCASERMKPVLVALLLEAGAFTNATASQRRTALHLACSTYQPPRVDYGKCSGDVFGNNSFQDSGLCGKHDPPHFDSRRGLHVLGEDHTAEQRICCQSLVVQLLLYHGASIDIRDSLGRTPIAYSIGSRAFHISKALLTANPPADINIRNDFGLTPLEWGADIHTKDDLGRTPLFIAAKKGNLELCHLLVAAGADIAAVDIHNRNCLMATLGSHRWECAKYFLGIVEAYEPDGLEEVLSMFNYEGLNCLIYCILLESEIPSNLADRFLSLYITAGLLNASNASGFTPLHIAVSFRSMGWVRALLNAGADPGIPDTVYGWTPTFMAVLEPLELSMRFLRLIIDSGKYTEDPEELMGWNAGATIFWLQLTLYLHGLHPFYYEIADRMRSLTIPRAVQAHQRESERRKAKYPLEAFKDLATRLLEQKGLLRWQTGNPPIERPPLDIFADPNYSYIRDHFTPDAEDINDHSRNETRLTPWGWKMYPQRELGKPVWIYDVSGRFRKRTFVHLMPRRIWRVWVMNDAGGFEIKSS